ncbi:MAG: GntP family permease [Tannerella sp.]|jgi:GntP family gluconate:H+ symporter|nr:GntP family permease [Tannerella sp.]
MTAWGAIIGLILSILLIIKKVPPVYSLIIGAVTGGLIGGFSLPETVVLMIDGVKDITPAILRILAAGVLSGVLVKTGAAASISNAIVHKLGERHVYLALALAAMLLTATGVFIDVAVITVAPVALSLGRQLNIPKENLLLVMIGGGKCGNIISPNPNTIVAAENFNVDLSTVMVANLAPAIIGLFFVVYILTRLMPKGKVFVTDDDISSREDHLPSFAASMVAPVVAILLLSLRPVCGVVIDPLIALPAGGLAGILAVRKRTLLRESLSYGLEKMSFVAILLVGTGAIAGIIKASTIKDVLLSALSHSHLGDVFIAPVSGALMSAATASTTAGATVASSSFAETILAAGISAVWGAAMINSGATVLDHLPHGSFFHATGGSANLSFNHRLKLIPYETLTGIVLAAGSVIACLLVR